MSIENMLLLGGMGLLAVWCITVAAILLFEHQD